MKAGSKQRLETLYPKAPLDEAPKQMWTYDKNEEKWLKVGTMVLQ
jgi:hypothetical protein